MARMDDAVFGSFSSYLENPKEIQTSNMPMFQKQSQSSNLIYGLLSYSKLLIFEEN